MEIFFHSTICLHMTAHAPMSTFLLLIANHENRRNNELPNEIINCIPCGRSTAYRIARVSSPSLLLLLLLFPFHFFCSSSSFFPLYLSRIWRLPLLIREYIPLRSTSHGVCAGLKFHRAKISLDRLLFLFRTTWTSSAFVLHILRLLTLVQIAWIVLIWYAS